jgi:hypothetical protein
MTTSKFVFASIGELYATLTNVDGLEEDSTILNPIFGKSQAEESSGFVRALETVIEFRLLEDTQGNP